MPTKLGQNFLKDEIIAEKIIKSAGLKPSDFVIEIGPGKGILTEKLAKCAKKIIAIEIDEKLVDYLKNKFENQKNIEIIHADILKMNLLELQKYFFVIPAKLVLDRDRGAGIQNIGTSFDKFNLDSRFRGNDIGGNRANYKLIANLPYYITSPIIRLFLESEYPPQEMILMVQKEVAERIVAPPGKMSKLSVAVQYYAKPKILFPVDKKYFNPVPQVDSAVIKITYNLQPKNHNKENAKKFFRIVRAGFCSKRKTLANNLSNSLHLDKKEVQEKIKTAGILPTVRAQELSIENWKKLKRIFDSRMP